MSSADPSQVDRGRARIDAGIRLPEEYDGVRPYFCRSCGLEVQSAVVPRGWYTIRRATTPTTAPIRCGVYCSVACIADALDRLHWIEVNLGDDFDRVASPFRQARSR